MRVDAERGPQEAEVCKTVIGQQQIASQKDEQLEKYIENLPRQLLAAAAVRLQSTDAGRRTANDSAGRPN